MRRRRGGGVGLSSWLSGKEQAKQIQRCRVPYPPLIHPLGLGPGLSF